ncbi:hypothetical protein [Jiulongibacter sediminis]|uniref:OmpA-like domain-containing protein n=1 Tax=Jiulongibacter sediminis TaxID=1605367 RepID=A0A0N8HA54_9BACT|nr:hypothetical protein [Jiulongibacter sediminis]KPM49220.1 hypothetical protein AFM12_00880 [Jiulongibacter sediminis]TBX26275.1 hypothetical protein TK44_00880 [Jiulongibacter sediminis]
MRQTLLLILSLLVCGSVFAQQTPPENRRVFVACPVVKDSETLPCWLAEYEGETYYLGQQGRTSSVFYPPQLKHKVLVEGTVNEDLQYCGGLFLEDVVISVLPELSLECNTILPATPGVKPPPPLPRALRPQFEDSTRHFSIYMDFDSDFLTYHRSGIIDEADRIAKIYGLKKVKIRISKGAVLLSNAEVMIEKDITLKRRADKLKTIFEQLGYQPEVHTIAEAIKPDGRADHLNRRIDIELIN